MTNTMTTRSHQDSSLRRRKGFTLIELIVVIAILAILAAIAIPAFSGTLAKAKTRADESTVQVIRAAVRLCQAETGSLPANAAALDTYIDGGTAAIVPQQGGTYHFYVVTASGAVSCVLEANQPAASFQVGS